MCIEPYNSVLNFNLHERKKWKKKIYKSLKISKMVRVSFPTCTACTKYIVKQT